MDVCTHRNNVNCVHLVPFVYTVFSRVLCVFHVCVCELLSPSLHVLFSPGLYIPTWLLSSGPGGELANFRVFVWSNYV